MATLDTDLKHDRDTKPRRLGKPTTVVAKGKWTGVASEVFMTLVQCGHTDGQTFCDELEKETGVYRSAAGLNLKLAACAAFFADVPTMNALKMSLQACAYAMEKRKKEFRVAEAKAAKKGLDALATWITTDCAAQILGKGNRVPEKETMIDVLTGLRVVPLGKVRELIPHWQKYDAAAVLRGKEKRAKAHFPAAAKQPADVVVSTAPRSNGAHAAEPLTFEGQRTVVYAQIREGKLSAVAGAEAIRTLRAAFGQV